MTLEDIYKQILKDEQHKRDIYIHPRHINVCNITGNIVLNDIFGNIEEFPLNAWSKTQWCSKMNGLTPKYWDECPAWLKAANGNYWLTEMVKEMDRKTAKIRNSKEGKGELLFRVREGGTDSLGICILMC